MRMESFLLLSYLPTWYSEITLRVKGLINSNLDFNHRTSSASSMEVLPGAAAMPPTAPVAEPPGWRPTRTWPRDGFQFCTSPLEATYSTGAPGMAPGHALRMRWQAKTLPTTAGVQSGSVSRQPLPAINCRFEARQEHQSGSLKARAKPRLQRWFQPPQPVQQQ